MKRIIKQISPIIALLIAAVLYFCSGSSVRQNLQAPTDDRQSTAAEFADASTASIARDGSYYSLEEVIIYLDEYKTLPDNFITKSEARALGWNGGSVEDYREGAVIGGDSFGNREGVLPKEAGRDYYECDMNTLGSDSRGACRLVFSSDWHYYYTDDHYETFSEYTVSDTGEVTLNGNVFD